MAKDDRGTTDQQIHDTKRGIAILATCIIQEVEAVHPGFTEHLGRRLERAYREVREDTDSPALDRLELINWVREMLTGWSPIHGQGKPFLE